MGEFESQTDQLRKAIIAAMPSSVVWPGIVWEGTTAPMRSSWSEQGEPLPHLPHLPFDASKDGTMADNYRASLRALTQHPEAIIPVERIAGRMMLVCAEDDRTSPSCPIARQIEQRLLDHGRPLPGPGKSRQESSGGADQPVAEIAPNTQPI